ncbi:helix-turn-helix domain containing protein [Arthrobacter sp. ATA002]|uniref:TetR/AcrR family transcriptional regulator n=1 Tax=Arthrobacter sp. ATA002 TaxID=2991715 RepID=UPI0022A6B0B0|nr:TetR/AcrR family transcriptional regulator [Arthrobacter sp. ATA002]WAP52128.1 helix-turn-helix domain containing protein [Arthrobacter sp. ATA002]
MSMRGPYAKGLAKRDEILETALELFAERGYDRTSMREIAKQAGLSQAGLLHYFSTKGELFLEVLRRRDDRITDPGDEEHRHSVDRLIRAVDRNSTEPGLVRLFVAMSAESAEEHSDAHSFFADRYRWLRDQIADDIRAHQGAGDITPAIAADNLASLLVAAADGLQVQWLLDREGCGHGQPAAHAVAGTAGRLQP